MLWLKRLPRLNVTGVAQELEASTQNLHTSCLKVIPSGTVVILGGQFNNCKSVLLSQVIFILAKQTTQLPR